jgi:ABC-type Mn2+/Zn2+ transport system ATPase subunit
MRSSSGETILGVEGACLGYPGAVVLENVDLSVGRGEFWFVIGPNGSGKTTLLRALLGLLDPLDGRVVRDPRFAARTRTGFVPQQCSFSHALPTTVREFVSLGVIGGDRGRSERAQDLAWALDRAKLQGMEDLDYWSLSGGQRQRALVARALVRRPSLLLLDEPTEGMDIGSRAVFLETVDSLHQEEESTILFVTHHIEIAARYATHVALVFDGRLTAGRREEMLEPERLERAFGVRGVAFSDLSASVSSPGDDA